MIALALAFQVAAGSAASEAQLEQIHNYVRISDQLATSGQMTYEQIDDIANAGFQVVVNLATASEERNGREGFLMAERGITYVNIPVPWGSPSLRDLDMFFAVMAANQDRKVLVHCFANMRASAFTYLYRTIGLEVDEETAREAMSVVWDPASQEQWAKLIEAARQRAALNR